MEPVQEHLRRQIKYANTYYEWPKIALSWSHFLNGVLNDRL